jgi:hypothetical protein
MEEGYGHLITQITAIPKTLGNFFQTNWLQMPSVCCLY